MVKTQKRNGWMGQWKRLRDALALLPGLPEKKSSEPLVPKPKAPLTDSDSIKGEVEPIANNRPAHRTGPSRGLRICFTPSRGVYCRIALRALEAATPRSKHSRRSGGWLMGCYLENRRANLTMQKVVDGRNGAR